MVGSRVWRLRRAYGTDVPNSALDDRNRERARRGNIDGSDLHPRSSDGPSDRGAQVGPTIADCHRDGVHPGGPKGWRRRDALHGRRRAAGTPLMQHGQLVRCEFPAMGTHATVEVVIDETRNADDSGGELLDHARRRVFELEARWSRFIATSEVSALNRFRGRPVRVSQDTRLLVRRAIEGRRLTAGSFNPTIFDAIVAHGYDRTFFDVEPSSTRARARSATAPGCEGIDVDDLTGTVTLSTTTGFDPGGIGKGLAADLVVDELIGAGAAGACVEIGGDVRVSGRGPEGRGWVVRIDHPALDGTELGQVWLTDGAVASSSIHRRKWVVDGETIHHLLDPRTARPTLAVSGASVIARTGWLAEVLATATCVDGTGVHIESSGACGFVVPLHGPPRRVGNVAEFVA